MSEKSRIIFDTNLWISFLITNNLTQLDSALISKKCIILFSQELLDEFIEVAARPKLRKYFDNGALENLIETIEKFSEFIDVTSEVKFLKDPKDDFLLSLALDGNADYLITGDKELLNVKNYGKTEIISFSEFTVKVLI